MGKNCRVRSVVLLVMVLAVLIAVPGFAQEESAPDYVLGLNVLGPLLGVYSGSFEIALNDDLSLFFIPTYVNVKAGLIGSLFEAAGVNEQDYELWGVSVAAGVNYFVTGTAPTGFFLGAWVEPGYAGGRFEGTALASDEDMVELSTVILSGGVHAGYRVLWGPVAITPRVGVAYSYVFTEAEGVSDDLETVSSGATRGFSVPWGVNLAIAF